MNYAINFRGISYHKDYTHDNRPGMSPYDIDFDLTITHYIENIINPLKDIGHNVDVFFNTYENKKLNYYSEKLKVKNIKLNNFDNSITYCNWPNIWQLMINSIEQVIDYEKNNNIFYDFLILTRFDILPFEKITNICLFKDSLNSIHEGSDMFIIIGRDCLDKFLKICVNSKYGYITHKFTSLSHQNGIKCHSIYPKNTDFGFNYPFIRNTRNIFTDKNHYYYSHSIEELFDENSKHYGFKFKPNKEFTSCF